MRALTRSASLLRRAAVSAPTSAALHHTAPGAGPCLTKDDFEKTILDLKIKKEKAIYDLDQKFKKSLLEQELSTEMALLQLKCELRKDANDEHNKHVLDNAAVKNELKILGLKFESHKLMIDHLKTQGIITVLKNFGWGVGAGTALLARFTNFPKIFSKTSGKD